MQQTTGRRHSVHPASRVQHKTAKRSQHHHVGT